MSDLLYRFWPVEGFNQPFVAGQNFGSWTDMMLTGSLEHGNWVPFNAIPTSAHTIWEYPTFCKYSICPIEGASPFAKIIAFFILINFVFSFVQKGL